MWWILLAWLLLALPASVVIGLCIGTGLSQDSWDRLPHEVGPA